MKFAQRSPLKSISRLTSTLCGLSFFMTATLIHADVMLIAPEEIDVVAINDQEISGGLFSARENSYKLDAGVHNISVRYKQLFEHRTGEHDVLKSDIVTLNQVQLQDGQNYTLTLVGAPSNFEEGKTFAEQPTVGVEDAQGQLIAKQTGASSKAKPWLSNGIFGSVLDLRSKDDEQKNVSNQSSMIARTSTQNITATNQSNQQSVAGVVTTTMVQPVIQNATTSGKAQQLIQIWQSATPQERQKFTAWLAEQATNQ